VPKRPPWADADDASGAPEEKRAKKQSDKDDALPAPEESVPRKKVIKRFLSKRSPRKMLRPNRSGLQMLGFIL